MLDEQTPPVDAPPLVDPPSVTVVAPMRNEQDSIERLFESLANQTYPQDKLEVLIVDGDSTDDSPDIVERYAADHPTVRLIRNPARSAATAMNAGIKAAQHDVIVRLDCHTRYEPDYIWNSVELILGTPGTGVVGGSQSAAGDGRVQRVIAAAMAERFAAGDAAYRSAGAARWADTVYLGAWQKATLAEVGGFNGAWQINEDYELNIRLREAGYGVLLSPRLKSTYYPRKSLGGLARQYRAYGFWRAKTVITHPAYLRWRQFAAPVLVSVTLAALAAARWAHWALLLPAAYFVALIIASMAATSKTRFRDFPLFAAVFATMHFAWGFGFLGGVAVWGVQRKAPRMKSVAKSE